MIFYKNKDEKTVESDMMKPNLADFLIEKDWKELLETEFQKNYFIQLEKYLIGEYEKGVVRPPKELIFNAFNLTKFNEVI